MVVTGRSLSAFIACLLVVFIDERVGAQGPPMSPTGNQPGNPPGNPSQPDPADVLGTIISRMSALCRARIEKCRTDTSLDYCPLATRQVECLMDAAGQGCSGLDTRQLKLAACVENPTAGSVQIVQWDTGYRHSEDLENRLQNMAPEAQATFMNFKDMLLDKHPEEKSYCSLFSIVGEDNLGTLLLKYPNSISANEANSIGEAACAAGGVLEWIGDVPLELRDGAGDLSTHCRIELNECVHKQDNISDYCAFMWNSFFLCRRQELSLQNPTCLQSDSSFSQLQDAACGTNPHAVNWDTTTWTAKPIFRQYVRLMSTECKDRFKNVLESSKDDFSNYCDWAKANAIGLTESPGCSLVYSAMITRYACYEGSETAIDLPLVQWNDQWNPPQTLQTAVAGLPVENQALFFTCAGAWDYAHSQSDEKSYCQAVGDRECLKRNMDGQLSDQQADTVINAACPNGYNPPTTDPPTGVELSDKVKEALSEVSANCKTRFNDCIDTLDVLSDVCSVLEDRPDGCKERANGCSVDEWNNLTKAACGAVSIVGSLLLTLLAALVAKMV